MTRLMGSPTLRMKVWRRWRGSRILGCSADTDPRGVSAGLGDPPEGRGVLSDETVGGGALATAWAGLARRHPRGLREGKVRGQGSGALTHDLPDGDRLSQSGRLAAPRDVDPHDPENDSGSCGKILDGEAAALDGLRVRGDPLLGWREGGAGICLPTDRPTTRPPAPQPPAPPRPGTGGS